MIDTSTIAGKVAYCLERWIEARCNDNWLAAAFIAVFHKDKVIDGSRCIAGEKYVMLKDFDQLTKFDSIQRSRQKFHEEKQYLPPTEVLEKRAEFAEQVRMNIVKPASQVDIFDL